MAKIIRATQKIFGDDALNSEITAFGTAKDNSPVFTKDPAQLQTAIFEDGWNDAVEADYAPFVEDTNGLCYLMTRQLAYLYQQGIPEWDAGTSYYQNSLCTIEHDSVWTVKRSVYNGENIGNDPITDDGTYWTDFFSPNVIHPIGEPIITLTNTLGANEVWLIGQTESRTGEFANLFTVWGTTFGAGDGSTTFQFPDFRNRAIWGATGLGYISAGLPNIKGNARFRTLTSMDDLTTPTSGALKNSSVATGYSGNGDSMRGNRNIYIDFDASKSNSIYGSSNTVQPPAIKVRVKTRYK